MRFCYLNVGSLDRSGLSILPAYEQPVSQEILQFRDSIDFVAGDFGGIINAAER